MTLFGRLLLVVNFVLSICFVALAGSVFTTQSTWKQKHTAVSEQLTQAQTALREAESAKNDAERVRDDMVKAAENERDNLRGRLDILQRDVESLTVERDKAEASLERQIALASTQSSEAVFSKESELVQRSVNDKLHDRLKSANQQVARLQDDLFTEQLAKSQIEREFIATAEQLAKIRRQGSAGSVVVAGSAPNTEAVDPPPEIDGLINATSKDDAGRVEFVAVTIGSDDGLKTGQTLYAFRPGSGNSRSQYLADVRLVQVGPDYAVARVVNPAKAVTIEKGDRVTSKL